jgi:hypothetical protein
MPAPPGLASSLAALVLGEHSRTAGSEPPADARHDEATCGA